MTVEFLQWKIVPFTRGRVLQFTDAPRLFPHFIMADGTDLYASQSCAAVIAQEYTPDLWRLVKPDGYLCLVADDVAQAKAELVKYHVGHEEPGLLVIQKAKPRQEAKPVKTAFVARPGAFGDLMQASSVFAGLKKDGFHVTLWCSPPGVDAVLHDPNVDRFLITDRDQIPNQALGAFFEYTATTVDRFVNLCESVEGTFLAIAGRTNHAWPHALRHKMLNKNYLEFQHELAQVPHDPQVKFYATLEEKAWARQQRDRMGSRVILWALGGSSVHKVNPHLDTIVARFMLDRPDTHVVLVGGPECEMLQAGWENEPRVHKTCGKWSIRQSLAFAQIADMVIGGETGVLNSVCCEPMPKVVFLSHSSDENLTRDWVNTRALEPDTKDVPCFSCHRLHTGWTHCHQHKESGQALCQWFITPDMIWSAVTDLLHTKQRLAA